MFTVDRTAPVVTLAVPANNATLRTGIVTASGTAADAVGVAQLTMRLFRAASGRTPAGYYNPTTGAYTATATAANEIRVPVPAAGQSRFSLRLPTLTTGRYALRVTATDRAGNASQATSLFTVTLPSQPSA